VVPNSIDHETFQPVDGVPAHSPTVLYVGKIAPVKGMPTLAEAIPVIVRHIQEVRVVLIGSDHVVPTAGSTKEHVLADLHRAGAADRVSVLAPVERSQLAGRRETGSCRPIRAYTRPIRAYTRLYADTGGGLDERRIQ
jgi:glycosyltransferase involved in cell wall biosynthesis